MEVPSSSLTPDPDAGSPCAPTPAPRRWYSRATVSGSLRYARLAAVPAAPEVGERPKTVGRSPARRARPGCDPESSALCRVGADGDAASPRALTGLVRPAHDTPS